MSVFLERASSGVAGEPRTGAGWMTVTGKGEAGPMLVASGPAGQHIQPKDECGMKFNSVGIRWGPWGWIKIRSSVWAHQASDSIFAEVDAFAWVQDWQVRRRLGGRVYRDRRFDSLFRCPCCEGVLASCAACSGSGRISLAQRQEGR